MVGAMKTTMQKRLTRQPKALVVAEGLALVWVIGVFDYVTGSEISFALFYLLPIFLVVSVAGKGPGVLVSFASATAWLIAELLWDVPVSYPIIPYCNAIIRLGVFLIFTLLVSSLKRALDREKELSGTDVLTGVRNARSFREVVGAEIERSKRSLRPFTVAYLDLDNFKAVNDCHGHEQGDELLRLVANTILTGIRKTDTVARLGGDEFALLLPETEYEAAGAVLKKIHEALSDELRQDQITCSIGAATFIRPPESVDGLIKKTDDLMYAAKKSGKNLICHEVDGELRHSGQHPHFEFGRAEAVERPA
jgi:diguanylate cyclase (GGDEF)-like protein